LKIGQRLSKLWSNV